MKKFLKIMLCIMGSLLAVIVAFWFSISYTVNYKKTTCDTSVSPDGKYELTLQAVGEPDWPFGSASGRLVLKEGEDKISQTDFELHNDGASISSSCWKVTWHIERQKGKLLFFSDMASAARGAMKENVKEAMRIFAMQ